MLNGTSYGNKINVSINAVVLSVRQKSQQEDHILSNEKNSYLIMTDKTYVSSRPILIFHSIYICLHPENISSLNFMYLVLQSKHIAYIIITDNPILHEKCFFIQYFGLIKMR